MPKKKNMTPYKKGARKRCKRLPKELDEDALKDVQNSTGDIIRVDGNEDMEMGTAMNNNAIQPTIMQRNGISQGSNHLAQSSKSSYRRRGPTKCKTTAVENSERIHVEFNERGQPIKSNSVSYSTFLGSIARKVTPITISDWHKVPQDLKENMWIIVKKKYIVPEHAKKLTLKMIGKSWREYKGRLRRLFYDIHDNDGDRIANCPTNVKPEDWKKFVAYVSKADYMEKRKKSKEVRKQHKIPHTCSRKGYARLEDEMKRKTDDPLSITRADVWIYSHMKKSGEPINDFAKEKIEKLNETNSSISCGKDDTLSQVFGPEPHGRVRGVGFGITSSILFGVQQNSTKMKHLEEELKTLREKVSSMEDMLAKVMESQEGGISAKRVKCKLFRLIPEDVVAHGYWCTDDPTTLVHHVPLGPGMSKVLIEAAVQGGGLLVRRTDELRTIEDAVGSFVAWPTSSITKE